MRTTIRLAKAEKEKTEKFQSQLCDTVRTTYGTFGAWEAHDVQFQSQLCDTVRTTGGIENNAGELLKTKLFQSQLCDTVRTTTTKYV